MRRFLFFVVLLPLAVIAVALSVANRQVVTLSLDPLGLLGSGWQVSLPLFVLLFAVLAIGVMIGGAAAWLGQSKWRYAARLERANMERLRYEMERLRAVSGRAVMPAGFDRDAA
jgi:uncharacterized membrane protein YciS (DUF1049 family)